VAPAAAYALMDSPPLATIPAIDTDYWRSQPDTTGADASVIPATALPAGSMADELECGSLTSGFESGVGPAELVEEPLMEQEAAPEVAVPQEEEVEAAGELHAAAAAPMAFSEASPATAEEAVEVAETVSAPIAASVEAPAEAVATMPGEPVFSETLEASEEGDETEVDRRRTALRTAARPPIPVPAERMEINVPQPVFDFSAASFETQQPQEHGLPVADLRERRCAALLDAAILAFTIGGFFLAFRLAGGEFTFSRASAAIGVAAAFLIFAEYILLFTMVGGSTPGMVLRGLQVTCFDGKAPGQVDLTWRGLGYLLSAAAGTLGFVWSAWDEHGLTWHDRISQTYITYAEPAGEPMVATSTL